MSGELNYSLTSPVEITHFKLQTLQPVEQLEKEVLMFFPPPSNAAASTNKRTDASWDTFMT